MRDAAGRKVRTRPHDEECALVSSNLRNILAHLKAEGMRIEGQHSFS
jgi:hypothetical protein